MLVEQRLTEGSLALNRVVGPDSGPPLLFLHGVCRRWQDFSPMIPALGWRNQIIGLDARGHGKSDRALSDEYLVVHHVQDAVAVLRQSRKPTTIYGHSMGAMVALAAAADAPESVRSLILEDPPFSSMGPNIAATPFYRQFVGMKAVAERSPGRSLTEVASDLADILVTPADGGSLTRLGDLRDSVSLRFSASCLAQMDPEALTPVIDGRWLDGYDIHDIVKRVECPVLLLQGEGSRGGMMNTDEADCVADGLKDCLRIEFPGVGHLIHWTQLETVLKHTIAFLESLE